MTNHDDAFHIEGIKEHVAAIKSYLPATKEEFIADIKGQDAILMRILALGEEIAHLSEEFEDKHPSNNWYKIVGLRNRIAHGYFEVDKDTIWGVLTNGSLDELDDL